MGVHIPVRKRVIGSASLLHKPVWGDVERTYAQKVLALGPIAYWPLWEESGTTAECLVNSAQNGTYSSDVSTWPVGTGIGDGNTAPQFDGANDYINVDTATLEAAIDGTEGTVATWFQVANAGVWTDGTFRYLGNFEDNVNNRFAMTKSNANNTLYFVHVAGGTSENHPEGGQTSIGWNHLAMTWSETADELRYYLNGAWLATDVTIGNWAGDSSWSPMVIGAGSGAPGFVWQGGLAHFTFWDQALGLDVLADLATV